MIKEDDVQLLPCPFCGGEAKAGKTVKSSGGGYYFPVFWVNCPSCRFVDQTASGYEKSLDNKNYDGHTDDPELEAEAARKWNTRAKPIALHTQTASAKVKLIEGVFCDK